jgi:hypothetical protein
MVFNPVARVKPTAQHDFTPFAGYWASTPSNPTSYDKADTKQMHDQATYEMP